MSTVNIDLGGKTAIVTGGARGIGLSVAKMLASAGANLAIIDVMPDIARQSAQDIKAEFKIEAISEACDITDYSQCDTTVRKIVETLGGVDILVNNAGITNDKLLLRMTTEDFKKVIDVNLTGSFNMTKASIKALSKSDSGSIINISSVIGLMGNPGQINYAASKAGLLGMTRSVAREYSRKGIRANAICPGFIQTAMTDALNPEYRDKLISSIPMSKMGTPEDVAAAVLFLASDLSAYITGQTLTVDGGMVMY